MSNQTTTQKLSIYQVYYKRHKHERQQYTKRYQQENKEHIREYTKTYYSQNKDNRQEYSITYRTQKGGKEKSAKTLELIGCTIIEVKRYLESQFLPGMNWSNYSKNGWHIDHIRPCNTFDLTDSQQQKQCFHYSNLRPLWSKDNLSRPKDGSDIIN